MSTMTLTTLTAAIVAAMFMLSGCAASSSDRIGMSAVSSGYICPLTGEQLPCPDCCPLNQDQAAQQTDTRAASNAEGYECPLTGEILPCPQCCPLND